MIDFGVSVGERVSFSKTVSESDVYLFAGITGDFFPNHVDAEFMRSTPYGQRIAHGVLTLALSSTASSIFAGKIQERGIPYQAVSLGYDRVRFLKPVFFGDTVTIQYTIAELDPVKARSISEIEAFNQRGELLMVARHILKWLERLEQEPGARTEAH